jgi:hypothetical protein
MIEHPRKVKPEKSVCVRGMEGRRQKEGQREREQIETERGKWSERDMASPGDAKHGRSDVQAKSVMAAL